MDSASASESSCAVVSSTARRFWARATSAANSSFITRSSPARPFSAARRTKFRTSWSAPAQISSRTSAFPAGSTCGFLRKDSSAGTSSRAAASAARSAATASIRSSSRAASKSARAYRRCATATLGRFLFQRREVELRDRLVDESPLVLGVEHLARDACRRGERELGDLRADLVERSRRLGLDLALGLRQAPLALGLGLLLHPLDLGVADLPRIREDLRGLPLGAGDQRPVLLEQGAGLFARVVGLVHRLANALPALVDRLLDRAERVPPEDEEGDPERDQRPDHEAGDDLYQAGGEDVRHLRRERKRAIRR